MHFWFETQIKNDILVPQVCKMILNSPLFNFNLTECWCVEVDRMTYQFYLISWKIIFLVVDLHFG